MRGRLEAGRQDLPRAKKRWQQRGQHCLLAKDEHLAQPVQQKLGVPRHLRSGQLSHAVPYGLERSAACPRIKELAPPQQQRQQPVRALRAAEVGPAHRTHGVAQRACQPALRVRGSPGVGGLQPEMQELAAAAEEACAQQVWGGAWLGLWVRGKFRG